MLLNWEIRHNIVINTVLTITTKIKFIHGRTYDHWCPMWPFSEGFLMRPVVPVRHFRLRRLNPFPHSKVLHNISLGKLPSGGSIQRSKLNLKGWGEVQWSKECRSLCPLFALGSKFCRRKLRLKIIKKDDFQVKFHVQTWGFTTRHMLSAHMLRLETLHCVCVCV